MFDPPAILFFYTETPLHAGSGSSLEGADLPIQREAHTRFPMIQSSGIKGALRDLLYEISDVTTEDRDNLREFRQNPTGHRVTASDLDSAKQKIIPLEIVFGPETDQAHVHGGALAFTDARLLLFPVRSFAGVFAWATCPTALERFKRELRLSGNVPDWVRSLTVTTLNADINTVATTQDSALKLDSSVILEDLAFSVSTVEGLEAKVTNLAQWLGSIIWPEPVPKDGQNAVTDDPFAFWRSRLLSSLVVVADEVFRDLTMIGADMRTRIAVGESGTVDEGPWIEENIPSDALLYTLAAPTSPRAKFKDIDTAGKVLMTVVEKMKEQAPIVQLGGDWSGGHGMVQATWLLPVTAPNAGDIPIGGGHGPVPLSNS